MEAPSFIGGVKGQLIVLLCGRAQWRGWEQTLTHTHTHTHTHTLSLKAWCLSPYGAV